MVVRVVDVNEWNGYLGVVDNVLCALRGLGSLAPEKASKT